MGSNMAEAHPVGFQWVMEAKARGAKVFHIDPRFTRTSAVADQHVGLRAGTDIAFLGGVINYILSNNLEFREYVRAYTNASFLLNERFQDTEDLDGLFSGYDPHTASYDPSTWLDESIAVEEGSGQRDKEQSAPYQHGGAARSSRAPSEEIAADPTLQHPRCVFQVLKRHFAATPRRWWSECAGCPADLFGDVCRAWTENSGRERTAALVYSVGWTQHTAGRAVHPGWGDHPAAARQHRTARRRNLRAARACQHPGLDRHPTLFNLLPGYLPMPDTSHTAWPATWTVSAATSRRDSGATPTRS